MGKAISQLFKLSLISGSPLGNSEANSVLGYIEPKHRILDNNQ